MSFSGIDLFGFMFFGFLFCTMIIGCLTIPCDSQDPIDHKLTSSNIIKKYLCPVGSAVIISSLFVIFAFGFYQNSRIAEYNYRVDVADPQICTLDKIFKSGGKFVARIRYFDEEYGTVDGQATGQVVGSYPKPNSTIDCFIVSYKDDMMAIAPKWKMDERFLIIASYVIEVYACIVLALSSLVFLYHGAMFIYKNIYVFPYQTVATADNDPAPVELSRRDTEREIHCASDDV